MKKTLVRYKHPLILTFIIPYYFIMILFFMVMMLVFIPFFAYKVAKANCVVEEDRKKVQQEFEGLVDALKIKLYR